MTARVPGRGQPRVVESASPSALGDEHLTQVLDRLTAVTQDLANAVATLAEREAHVTTMTSTLLDTTQFAAILGCDPRTLRRWIREAEVPAPIRIGGTLRWRRKDVDAWLEAQK